MDIYFGGSRNVPWFRNTRGRTTPLQHLPPYIILTLDDATPREIAEWQVEVLSHGPAASTESSTMSFPLDAMNRINETEGDLC
jgi:hypothetical protein